MSCIILLTLNELFVENHLIPSIIANSKSHGIEIIIAYNGYGCDISRYKNVKVVNSPHLWVAKGYNTGVLNAKGDYIALFHDDCFIRDKNWIEKAITKLDEKVIAVSPEMYKNIAKCVPLIMRRTDYLNLGGFDEQYFWGIEDADFTYSIRSAGKTVEQCSIDYVHYKGMSTVLLLAKNNTEFKKAFGNCSLSQDEVEKLRNHYLPKAYTKGYIASAFKDKLYMLRKHKSYLFGDNHNKFRVEEVKLEKAISRLGKMPDFSPSNKNILEEIEKLRS